MSDEKQTGISRRNLVTGMAGVAAATLAAGTPAGAQNNGGGSTAAPFVNPVTKYPMPPYPGQSQPWPGLASKITASGSW